MSFFVWKEIYSVANPRIDEQHQKLISFVLSLKKNFEAGEDGIEERIMEFLKMRLNGHILGMDRRYRGHVTANCHL